MVTVAWLLKLVANFNLIIASFGFINVYSKKTGGRYGTLKLSAFGNSLKSYTRRGNV